MIILFEVSLAVRGIFEDSFQEKYPQEIKFSIGAVNKIEGKN